VSRGTRHGSIGGGDGRVAVAPRRASSANRPNSVH